MADGLIPEEPVAEGPGALRRKRGDRPTGARRLDLDRARGFAILLVVFGHLMGRARPDGMDWYEAAFVGLYSFHMPFFMYLSGYTAQLSGMAGLAPAAWPRLVGRRAQRLLLPFVLMGFVIVFGKYLAAAVMHVDAPPSGLAEGLYDAFWNTAESPVIMIWYLWVLFFVSLGALVLLNLPGLGGRLGQGSLLAVGLLLFAIGLPPVMYLNKLADHAVFFAIGMLVAAFGERAMAATDRLWPAALALLLALAAATVAGWIDRRDALLVCGLAAVPALHGLVRRLDRGSSGTLLLFLGRYSMAIYLFNTIAIGLAKAALIRAGVVWSAAGA
ncbi:MAG: acyltransferase, partial [Acetobacteraceae bacterium]|nr:acyltransferase [Acetobacteraceae bacterium]